MRDSRYVESVLESDMRLRFFIYYWFLLFIFYYFLRLPEIRAIYRSKERLLESWGVMTNRARSRKIKLNPGFGSKNVTGNLRDRRGGRFSSPVRGMLMEAE